MNLQDIESRERELLRLVGQAKGTMEAKIQWLEGQGVFPAYAEVHQAYLKLAEDGDVEALKRALFIQWYAQAEPACFTGIRGLDANSELRLFTILEAHLHRWGPDEELRWMIPYYYMIADWYLDRFPGLGKLQHLSRQQVPTLWSDGEPQAEWFLGRGQMGDYWISIKNSAMRGLTTGSS